ncbi:formate dehydrogenase subunit gamma [Heliorestis convoluta]|uniref:Formate dehydrogenase, gamma subunit n=1 Tax=Heliorestis convoluta TaxID=356322 RepID=A0A5Q2MXW8_9FIRM|nr:cytochrome b/b6 domain-containing protein [Heliorestis convoluta]QGG46731.1 formate dehydrogenase, gamma subunit [Heliorestis convoluta]
MAKSKGPMVEKFPLDQRVVHWIGSISFIICALTGLLLFTTALDFLAPLFGGKATAGRIHLISGIVFAITPLIALIWNGKNLIHFLRDISHFDKDDIAFLKGFFPYIMNSPGYQYPPQGKYNGGEKLQALAQVFLGVAIIITGFILAFDRFFSPLLLQLSLPIHSIAALVTMLLALGHIFFAAINPRSNAALSGMINGKVPVEKVKISNTKWYEQLKKEKRI